MFEKLKSRKLWMAVLAAVLTVVGDALGFSEVTQWIIGLLGGTYVIGQGVADHGQQGQAQGAAAASAAEAKRQRIESELEFQLQNQPRQPVMPQFQQPQPGYYPPQQPHYQPQPQPQPHPVPPKAPAEEAE